MAGRGITRPAQAKRGRLGKPCQEAKLYPCATRGAAPLRRIDVSAVDLRTGASTGVRDWLAGSQMKRDPLTRALWQDHHCLFRADLLSSARPGPLARAISGAEGSNVKHKIRRFKNLKLALKELEPFIRDGKHLQTGKPLKRFGGLRPRELLVNWLLCVVGNFAHGADRLTFTTDPLGGDGIICDTVTERTWAMEHVLVPSARSGEVADGEALILKAIESKQSKGGAAYASGKTLVVLLNVVGLTWTPNRVARRLPKTLHFAAVYVVGLALQGVETGEYAYHLTRLDLSGGNAPIWRVRIVKEFEGWEVEQIQ
jgi:hypothetical protein